jgi:hypothetical protein
MVSKRRSSPPETNNTYFKPVDSSHEFKFLQVDTKFSYVDIDLGPEFIGFDPIPDLIEVDIGPSVVSQELVRSPVEIKISALLKTLLAPTPPRRDTTTTEVSTETSEAIDGHTHQRANDARPKGRQTIPDLQKTQDDNRNPFANQTTDALTALSGRDQSTEGRPQSTKHDPGNHHRPTVDVTGFDGWKNEAAIGREFYDDRTFLGRNSLTEEALRTQDSETVDESTSDVGLDYSPPQWDADPFGMADFDLGFDESEESAFGAGEQAEPSFGAFDWEGSVSIEGPAVEPGFGEEMFGLDGFAESHEGVVGLPGLDTGNNSSPLFPDGEGFFSDGDLEEDWSLF